ncbi:MAG: glycosyltransferase family 2 protein [Thermoleophilaceae bacterium]
MDAPAASIVIPTVGRVAYLEVTLDSLASQDAAEPYEVLVVDDAAADATRPACERRGVRCLSHAERRGANAARNSGLREAKGELVLFIDDDVEVPPGWLGAYLEGARRYHESEAFGGPIRPRLEGPTPRACGREDPPITALDLGKEDRECEVVWSANMGARRSAFERVGDFDESLQGGGEEQEWLERLRGAGGRIHYLADAGLDHRREGDDARLRPLMRAAYARGRAVRHFDSRRGIEPSLARELRVVAGCGWHTLRRGCPQGLVMGAHSLGRTVEAVRPR